MELATNNASDSDSDSDSDGEGPGLGDIVAIVQPGSTVTLPSIEVGKVIRVAKTRQSYGICYCLTSAATGTTAHWAK